MPLLAIDDTDTRDGGCTTRTAFHVAEAITRAGGALDDWGLYAPPRLVRLDPAAPHRTRGNGALVLPVGPLDAAAPRIVIGAWSDGAPIHVPQGSNSPQRAPGSAEHSALSAILGSVLPGLSENGDREPAALLLPGAPPESLYRAGVSRLLAKQEAARNAPRGSHRFTPAGRRGEIGALAAAAWLPERERRWTWEFTAYRDDEDHARERHIPPSLLAHLATVPGGFDNVDPATGRIRAVPRTPCPVRFAARGTDPHALLSAFLDEGAGSGGWLLQTNQATADHARHAETTLRPHSVIRTRAVVTGAPHRLRGGHLFVTATTPEQAVRLVAFEPTKGLRAVLAAAHPGDVFEVLARTGEEETGLHVEAVQVLAAPARLVPGPNPRCAPCGGAMKSRGRDAGYGCPRCGTKADEGARERRIEPRSLRVGAVHQVPDHVRGHLLPPRAGLDGAHALHAAARGRPITPVFAPSQAEARPAARAAPTPA